MNKTNDTQPPRYHEWLTYVFDRSPSHEEYLHSSEQPFQAPHAEIVELITYTMLNCGRDLLRYTDGQVDIGLNIIFNPSHSDLVFSIKDDALPLETRVRAITSLKTLYSDCFEPRCAPVALVALAEPCTNPLNSVCFVLWDVTPLAYWERDENRELFYSAVLDVLKSALECENVACVESALHGLGHVYDQCQDRVPQIISRYLNQHPGLRQELRQYASAAAQGVVL